VPAAKLEAVAVEAPLLQLYPVAVPVVTVTVAEPLLALHEAAVLDVVIVGAPVFGTTALAVAEQPPLPVTVTV